MGAPRELPSAVHAPRRLAGRRLALLASWALFMSAALYFVATVGTRGCFGQLRHLRHVRGAHLPPWLHAPSQPSPSLATPSCAGPAGGQPAPRVAGASGTRRRRRQGGRCSPAPARQQLEANRAAEPQGSQAGGQAGKDAGQGAAAASPKSGPAAAGQRQRGRAAVAAAAVGLAAGQSLRAAGSPEFYRRTCHDLSPPNTHPLHELKSRGEPQYK